MTRAPSIATVPRQGNVYPYRRLREAVFVAAVNHCEARQWVDENGIAIAWLHIPTSVDARDVVGRLMAGAPG